ncbi:MAG TPA: hypothetical protein VJR89_30775 [Polyangiales bacterium]|nr:hypothetical protein [Polyangiales bacterium]
MTRPRQLSKVEGEAGAALDSDTVSAVVRDFAAPLLYVDPAGPSDIETVRTSLMLAMICWNLPVYELQGSPLYAQGKRTLEAVSEQVPRSVALALQKLIADRKAKLASMPFLVLVEVKGTTPENATIVAEARMPSGPRS